MPAVLASAVLAPAMVLSSSSAWKATFSAAKAFAHWVWRTW